MNDKGKWRCCLISAVQFGAAMAIVLWPAGGWAQSDNQAVFTPAISQKVEARSEPAKVTTEDESALKSKGYVKIGRIFDSVNNKKTSAGVREGLRAAALSKAAEAGGDVVRFEKDGVEDTRIVTTGTETVKTCDVWRFGQCAQGRTITAPVTKKEVDVLSYGTVWRYDPILAADVAREEAARKAAAADMAFDPLEERLSKGQYAEAELLLAHGFDVNARDKHEGLTHLCLATVRGEKEPVELLLAHGAQVNAVCSLGSTPLDTAASHGKTEVAEVLLAHGAEVNAKKEGDITPLHTAAYLGEKGVADLLLAHGADVNAKDKSGQTPLHCAATEGRKDVVELLLAHGADVNARDNMGGQTPLRCAADKKHKDIVQVLREHGGHK